MNIQNEKPGKSISKAQFNLSLTFTNKIFRSICNCMYVCVLFVNV